MVQLILTRISHNWLPGNIIIYHNQYKTLNRTVETSNYNNNATDKDLFIKMITFQSLTYTVFACAYKKRAATTRDQTHVMTIYSVVAALHVYTAIDVMYTGTVCSNEGSAGIVMILIESMSHTPQTTPF